MSKTNEEKLEILNDVDRLLSKAWLLLYDLDTDIDGTIPETRHAVNNAQCRLIEARTELKVQERDEI